METTYQRMVRNYADAIYIYGTRTFASINTIYHEDIKKYAAANFTDAQIDNALAKGWITDEEYQQTLAYKVTPTV